MALQLEGFEVVDDLDPRIRYSTGWEVHTEGVELNGTKHGATRAGMTATFNFTGTVVMVLGPVGSWDVHGVPSTSYAIDGKVLSNYTAPTVESGTFESDVLYFTSPTLDQGKHTLTITNLNGTAPNVFWLDYILYAPTPLDEPATSIASDNAAPTSKSSSSSSPSSTSTEVPVSITTTESRTNVGAIAGGAAAGGVVLLAILGLLALWLLRRRRRRHQTDSHGIIDEIQPFTNTSRHASMREAPLLSPTTGPKSAITVLSPPGSAGIRNSTFFEPDPESGGPSRASPSPSLSPVPPPASAPTPTLSPSPSPAPRADTTPVQRPAPTRTKGPALRVDVPPAVPSVESPLPPPYTQ